MKVTEPISIGTNNEGKKIFLNSAAILFFKSLIR